MKKPSQMKNALKSKQQKTCMKRTNILTEHKYRTNYMKRGARGNTE